MTKIEWADKTWNPTTGCTKISEGCQNCYAEKMLNRLNKMKTKKNKYLKPFTEVVVHEDELNRYFPGENKLIFVNSMSDLFHEKVSDEVINRVLYNCFQEDHEFLILTKRSERLREFKPEISEYFPGKYCHNIWLGVSVELEKYKYRIDDLRQAPPARVKFLSCEPLLGDLGELDLSRIDWVIVGGESGKNARPMEPRWVKNIIKQCREQKVLFFFKQWGEWQPHKRGLRDKDHYEFVKVGKKRAGRLFDGEEYNEMPLAKG